MNKLILCGCLCICLSSLSAQSYFTAAGARVGDGMGITVNQRILRTWSVEGILQSNPNDVVSTTWLVKKHVGIFSRGFNVYFGGGAHNTWGGETPNRGIDGVFGMEMSISRVNVSLDYKPAINLQGAPVYQGQGALSVRYILFKPTKKNKQNWRDKEKNTRQKQRARKKDKKAKIKEKEKANGERSGVNLPKIKL